MLHKLLCMYVQVHVCVYDYYVGHDIGVMLKDSPGTLSGEMITLWDTLYTLKMIMIITMMITMMICLLCSSLVLVLLCCLSHQPVHPRQLLLIQQRVPIN